MKPNRKIMPSRWTLTGPDNSIFAEFNQKILGKMVNPIYKTALTIKCGQGSESYCLVDPRKSIPDRVLGPGPHEWTVLKDEKPVAKLVRLPGQAGQAKGLLGKIRNIFAATETGIVSAGEKHTLPAPVALGMILLFNELKDTCAG